MKSTRKLFLATMLLVLSLTAVVASTFAWFSIQTNPQIDTVRIEVTSGQALRISLDADSEGVGTYKTNWSVAEFWDAVLGQATGEGFVLDTVTPQVVGTAFTPGVFNMIEYVLADATDYAYDHYKFMEAISTAAVEGTPTYIEFDIWFEADTDLSVQLSAGTVNPADAGNETDVLGANITRLGFNVIDGDYFVYDPRPTSVAYGAGQAANQFFNNAFLLGNFPEMLPTYQDDEDEYYPSNIVVLVADGSHWQLPADNMTANSNHTMTLATELFEIEAGVAGRQKVTVYIWLEGWDGDATDQAKGALIDVFMRFVGNPVVTP